MWLQLGWNTAFVLDGEPVTTAAANGIWVIQNADGGNAASSLLPGTGAETVGFLTEDEPSTFAEGVSTPISSTPNSLQDGRFWWLNDTWNFIEYPGLKSD